MTGNVWKLYCALCIVLLIGCLYFLCVLLQLPLAVSVAVIVVAASAALYFLQPLRKKNLLVLLPEKQSATASFVMLLALGLLVYQSTKFATKYGDWDAWAIWNLSAKFLAQPEHWKQMLHYDVHLHPDYPLLLPSTISFFWRIIGSTHFMVPFIIATSIFLAIPGLIFLELRNRSLLFACLVLFWFAADDWYARHALSQYADTMLAFFFLAAIISTRHYGETRNRIFLLISGACCGGCIWTKNEGIVLALLLIAFYFRHLLCQDGLMFLAGISLPLSCYVIFKVFYAPSNDLVSRRNEIPLTFLTDSSRYALIWNSMKHHFSEQYYYHKLAAFIWLVYSALRQRWTKEMLLVISCFGAYLLVYLLTPMDLQWHLNTSFDRLIHQLAPAFMYCFAAQFTRAPKNTKQLQLAY